MSRKGDCCDNSVSESSFSTLKRELVYHAKLGTRYEARAEIFNCIEVFHYS